MGFDNECIVNIQSLAGEYFCPVCRLLVYPNEALQSQCTHLYCKPCLTYVVGTTRACPYDGYLVTETDSKLLIESNKALAETIGNIVVHCLYHRSGCEWQGPLSECTSHCSGCAFGNSPVVCNRCGIQIVHCEVQEHAQNCPGVQPQAPQLAGVQDASATATAAATPANAEQSQTANQSGASTSQIHTSQIVAAPPTGQDSNQHSIVTTLAQAVTSVAMPTPEQWYQQQYQQYYHQYPGYDPYQQNYHPYQLQTIQQYQQLTHVQAQHQPQVYSQPQPQPQPPPHFQPQVQPQPQPPPQTHQPQIQPQGPQSIQLVQASVAAHDSVNPQHQLHPTVKPHVQMQSQAHPLTHSQPQPYAQAQPHPQTQSIQPHSLHHIQMPQYQQPHSQMQHPQPPIRPQSHVHPQHPQLQPQSHLQAHSQPQLQPQLHPRPQLQPPPQLNLPPNPNAQSQIQLPPAQAVTARQSHSQPQAHLQMQLGTQHTPPMPPQSGPTQHYVQMHGQFPQPPPQMCPPQSHAPLPNQQRPALLPSQGQAQQQLVHPHAQQPGHPVPQCPIMQPMQPSVPQQYLQHQQPFPGQTLGPVQNQLHPHGHFVQQQQPMQSQLRSQGPPHLLQQNSQDYISSQQNATFPHGLQSHQSQNYAARPMMPNHGAQTQPFPQSPAGFTGASHVRPTHLGANQPLVNKNYPLTTNKQMLMSSEQQEVQSGLTLKSLVLEKQGNNNDVLLSKETALEEPNGLVSTSGVGANAVQVKNWESETDVKLMDVVKKPMDGDGDNNGQVDMQGKGTNSELHPMGNASAEPAINHVVKKESRLEFSPGSKCVEIVDAEQKDATNLIQQGEHSTSDGTSLQAESFEEQSGKLPKDAIDAATVGSGGADKTLQPIPLASACIPESSAQSQTPLTGEDLMQHGSQEINLSQSQPTTKGPGVANEFSNFQSHGHALGQGIMHPAHPFPPTDQGRHHHMSMHYGPSTHQQRPAGTAMLQSAPPPGPPLLAQVPNMLRPQGTDHLPLSGQPINHFQSPVLKQPQGSFHSEISSGGILGPSSSSFGRGPSHVVALERSFERQAVLSQGHYNHSHMPPTQVGLPRMPHGQPPGSFNSPGGIMGRVPPHGPEGQIGQPRPVNPVDDDFFSDQRSLSLNGRQPDFHLFSSSVRAPLGQPPGIESNMIRMNGPPGTEPAWCAGRGELEEDLKHFPRHPHLDTEPAPKFESYISSARPNDGGPHDFSVDAVSRPLGKEPHGSGGSAPRSLRPYHRGGPNDSGDRARPVGPNDNGGRADSTHTHADFLGPVPGFGPHHMDQFTSGSPGTEHPVFPSHDFGGLSGFPRNQSGLSDIDGGESLPFGEGSSSFNFPSDPVGNPFHESRFPFLPGLFRRGALDGPGHMRSSGLIGQDTLPSHLRRGKFLGPRNLHGHFPFGEPDGFGAFRGHSLMGNLAGFGNFLPHLPLDEPYGGSNSGHPRLSEPGFRSNYSVSAGMDSFENSRKRKPASRGWCRICKVDCSTVEGLDLHAQTREHQTMAMDIVLSIKRQNAKKQKTSNDHSSLEEQSKSRGSGYEVRGKT